ncbi:MAG: hypothetical protein NTW87_02405 [Planctomycetota bacterium]|nr:hypothetical protein [Planctomycetota bacterium]
MSEAAKNSNLRIFGLAGRLKQQFDLIKAGKNPEMNMKTPPIHRARWQLDAP